MLVTIEDTQDDDCNDRSVTADDEQHSNASSHRCQFRGEMPAMTTYSARGTVSVRPYVTVDPVAATDDEGRWSARQISVVGICFLINMLDGMDVLIMSYIAPALSVDWSISAARLGVVFSAGLAGMAVGGLLIAPLADRFGRRTIILSALVIMTGAMFVSAHAEGVATLIASRFVVGMGIGTVLAGMAAITAEYAPPRHRNFAVGFLQAGYPVGATLTGFAVAALLPHYGWQWMLLGAGVLSLLSIPLVLLLVPESIEFLTRRQPKGALEKINRLRRSMNRSPLSALPALSDTNDAPAGVRGLFADGRGRSTILLWIAIVFSFMTLYFVISWIPKLAIQAGLASTDGIYAGAVYNIGAFVGTTSIGVIATRLPLQRLILGYMVCAGIALTAFGAISMPLMLTLITAFTIGVFVQGGFNGFYPLAAELYPSAARSTGIGWAMGIGRIGAVIGPLLGGALIDANVSLAVIFGIFAVPVILAGLCASLIRTPGEKVA